MNAKLLVADCSKETGALLKEYLTERGVAITTKTSANVISYGVPHPDAINGNCGKGKIYNMKAMSAAYGVQVVPWFHKDDIPKYIKYPLLARREYGFGGTDIVPVFQAEELPWRIASGWEWFSQYVPIEQEYRVWVFQGECLDIYRKQLNRPQDYKYIGRNFRNGFDFVLDTFGLERNVDAVNMAAKAVKALDLDFGAVDLVRGKDGYVYVLEVNSAPGVIKSGAQKTLGKLADCLVEAIR